MHKYFKLLYIVIIGITINACSNPNEPNEQMPTDLIELINSIETFPQPSTYNKVIDPSSNPDRMRLDLDTLNEKWWQSVTAPYKFTQRFEATINLNANQSDIYPGSIVQGKYLLEGRAVSIGEFGRKPITITMANGGGSKTIENPSYAEISKAMNELIAQKSPIPAILDYEITEMYSVEQALMEFGLDIGWGFLSAGAMYSTNMFDKRNSVFLCFKQIYYTMTIGNNRSATDLFANNINVSQLHSKTGEGNPLCVINEVDYGRIIMVKITSTESYEEIIKSVKAGIKFTNSGNAKFETTNSAFNSSYEFKAQVIGGKATDAAKVVDGIDAVFDIIKKGADYADGNPGFPIFYRATYLKNNEPVLSGKTTSYDEVITTEQEGISSFEFDKIILNKFNNNISSIKNPKLTIYWYNNNDSYRNYVATKTTFNKTFNIDDKIDISQYKCNIPIPAKKGEEFYIVVYLYTENDEEIGNIMYTFKISHLINRFSGDIFSQMSQQLSGYNAKLYQPDGTNWETTFYYKHYFH